MIYKIIARFGLESELDSTICATLKKAYEMATLWLKQEDCDSVSIYEERVDEETQTYRTYKCYTVEKPF